MKKRRLLPLLALVLLLLALAGCGTDPDWSAPPYEGTWYAARNAVECRIGEGKIYQDDLHAQEGQTLVGIYTEAEDRLEAHLSGVGGVETPRLLYLVQTDDGQVLQDSPEGQGTVYFYRDPLSAMAALEDAEAAAEAELPDGSPAPTAEPDPDVSPASSDDTSPAPSDEAPSDEAPSRALPGAADEPSDDPAPAAGAETGGTVWIPQSGTKYHSIPSCSGMKDPVAVTKAEAERRGYTPCKRCF